MWSEPSGLMRTVLYAMAQARVQERRVLLTMYPQRDRLAQSNVGMASRFGPCGEVGEYV